MKAAPIPAIPAFCPALRSASSTARWKLPASVSPVGLERSAVGEQAEALAERRLGRRTRGQRGRRDGLQRTGPPGALRQAPLLLGQPPAQQRQLDLLARDLLLAPGELDLAAQDLLPQLGPLPLDALVCLSPDPGALGLALRAESLLPRDQLLGHLLDERLLPLRVGRLQLAAELLAAPLELLRQF